MGCADVGAGCGDAAIGWGVFLSGCRGSLATGGRGCPLRRDHVSTSRAFARVKASSAFQSVSSIMHASMWSICRSTIAILSVIAVGTGTALRAFSAAINRSRSLRLASTPRLDISTAFSFVKGTPNRRTAGGASGLMSGLCSFARSRVNYGCAIRILRHRPGLSILLSCALRFRQFRRTEQ